MSETFAENNIENLRNQLRNKIQELSEQGDLIWNKIIEDQQVCTDLIIQQVMVNGKFSDYHELWMRRHIPSNINSFHRFNEIDETTITLGNLLGDFETRTHAAMHAIKELIETYQTKFTYISEVRMQVMRSAEITQLQALNLEEFEWMDPDLLPKVMELNHEWLNANLIQRISDCVDDMELLVGNGPDNPAGVSSEGSSSSPEAFGVENQVEQQII